MNRKEEFPISDNLVLEFIEKNKKKWKANKNNDKYIYINLSMVRMQVSWVIPKLVYAKGIEERTGAKPVALVWRENELLRSFFSSFGVEYIAIDSLIKKNFPAFVLALVKTLGLCIRGGDGEKIKKIKMCGFNVGMYIYEDILRTSDLSTIKEVRNKICVKKCMHILWAAYGLYHLCNRKKPLVAIADDMAYHEGVFIKVFKKCGARVLASSNVGEEEVTIDEKYNIERRMLRCNHNIRSKISDVDESAITWTDNYLEEKFCGKVGKDLDRGAFKDKKILSKEQLQELLGMDIKKKNAIIMAHTFTDAVFNYGNYYFRDYYDWIEKTLKIASTVGDVNWILKPHPTRSAYNEEKDSIENLFEKYKQGNMFILSDDISAESIRYLADVIITIGGSAGGEFACFGIPSVIVGKPYYSGFGYTIEPASFKEYEQQLNSIAQIEGLNGEQIKIAKKVFYLQNCGELREEEKYSYQDEFANVVNSKYKGMISEIAVSYFKNNDGTKGYNGEALKDIMKYMESHDVKETAYYKQGLIRGSETIKNIGV